MIVGLIAVALPLSKSHRMFQMRMKRKNRIEPSFLGTSILADRYGEPVGSNGYSAGRCYSTQASFPLPAPTGTHQAAPQEGDAPWLFAVSPSCWRCQC